MSGNDYPLVSLQSIAKITTGNTPKTSNTHYYDADDISFFKPSDLCAGLVQCLYRSDSHLSESARPVSRIVPKNSILCTCIGIVGKVGILSHEAAFNQQINAATVDESIAVPGYIAHAIQFQASALQKKANAAVVPIINKKAFSLILVPLPDIETQAKLYGNLSSIQAEIERYKSVGERLEQLVKSRFVEMFGDPVTNSKGLEIGAVTDYSENLDSMRIPITQGDRIPGPYPYIGASGAVDSVEGYIFDETLLLVSEDGANLLTRSTPIAFTVTGKTWVNNHAHVLRCHNDSVRVYIETLINMIDISEWVTGTAQPKLNQKSLNKIPIPMGDESDVESFAAFVAQVDKSQFAVRQSIKQLELLKAKLMQEYFG